MTTLIGHVTALLARGPSHEAAPVVVELYIPAEPPGSRTRRFDIEALCEPRELAMVSVLRDALVHHLVVEASVQGNRLDAVEVHLPVWETYADGPRHEVSGRITWLAIAESAAGVPERGQPDLVTVIVENRPAMLLVLERRQPQTKHAQLALLQHAFATQTLVHITWAEFPVSPGNVQRLIVEAGVGTKPLAIPPRP
jgi:hypothetical protein